MSCDSKAFITLDKKLISNFQENWTVSVVVIIFAFQAKDRGSILLPFITFFFEYNLLMLHFF